MPKTFQIVQGISKPFVRKKLSKYLSINITEEPLILCIGTDRCIGDVLAPLTGTILQRLNVNFPYTAH